MDPVQAAVPDDIGELKRRLAEAEAALKTLSSSALASGENQFQPDGPHAALLTEGSYRDLFLNMPQGYALHEIICDKKGKPIDYRFLEANIAFERLTNLSREDIIGKLASQVLPGLEPFWIKTYGDVALTGRSVQFTRYTQALNRYYQVYAYCPAPRTFAAIFIDITDHKQIEIQLNEVATKYSTLFNATSDGVWIHNLDGEIQEVNDAYCHMSGYSRQELLHMPVSMLEACESPAEVDEHIRKLLRQEGHDRFESRHRRKDGSTFDVDITALYYDLEGGRIAIFVRDITERKQSEEHLEYLASFPEDDPGAVLEFDLDGNVRYANPAARKMFPDLMKQGLSKYWLSRWKSLVPTLLDEPTKIATEDIEFRGRFYQLTFKYHAAENLVRVFGIDITERVQAEKRQAYLATFPEQNPRPIVEVDLNGHVSYANPAAVKLFPDLLERGVDHEWLADWESAVRPFQEDANANVVRDVAIGERFYQQTMNYLPDIGLVRMYGLDITARKKAEVALIDSEKRLNRAQEMAHLGSWELDLTTDHLTWSDEVYRMFGYTSQEFKASYEAFLEAVHPDDRVAVDNAFTSSIREGRDSYEIEHRLINHATGEVRIVHEKCIHFRDEDGEVIRSEGMVHDITEQKLAVDDLRKTRDELEQRVQARTLELSSTNVQLHAEIEQHQSTQTELESTVQELQVIEEELRNNNEMLEESREVLYAERMRYQDLFEYSPDGYLVTDLKGVVLEANQIAVELLQISHKNLIGKPLVVYIHADDHPIFNRTLARIRNEPSVKSLEIKLVPRHGEPITTGVTIATAKDESGKSTLRWTFRDITERKRAEEIILQNSLRNAVLSEVSQSLAEASLDEPAILDIMVKTTARLVGDSCVITLASEDKQWLDPVAWSHKDPISQEVMDALYTSSRHPSNQGAAGQVYQTSQPLLIPKVGIPANQEDFSPAYREYIQKVGINSLIIVPLQINNQTIGTMGLTRDTAGKPFSQDDLTLVEILAYRTAQTIHNARLYRELQTSLQNEMITHEQLLQAEKFAAVGRLLASITHEINNPLQTIKNCLYLSQVDIAADSPMNEYLRMATAETNRLSNLVAQLREVYRPPTKGQSIPVDLPHLLGEVQTLLTGYLLEKHVLWKVNPPDVNPFANLIIDGVPDQLKQVFLNISLNAIDAMEPDGGSITVDLKISEDQSLAGISFKDTGPGLPKEVMDRLFEPFVTTKEKGLGLGLVICYDIIQKHAGRIDVHSKPGKGAVFTVWLPVRRE